MRQTLTIEKLKALSPCNDKYLHMFGEHESMNIEQAFDAGFSVPDICWLMGELDKRAEILAFANFCAKQAADAAANTKSVAATAAVIWANDAAVRVAVRVAGCVAAEAAETATVAADVAAVAAAWDAGWAAARAARAAIRKEQKQFLMEILI